MHDKGGGMMKGVAFCRMCKINVTFPLIFYSDNYPRASIDGICKYCGIPFIGFWLSADRECEKKINGWFSFDSDWHCPGCGCSWMRFIHDRPNGKFSGIEEHHFGNRPTDLDKYYEGKSILLCHRCNSLEPHIRRILKSECALPPEAIAAFLEKNRGYKTW
jgi:hypothetical protein